MLGWEGKGEGKGVTSYDCTISLFGKIFLKGAWMERGRMASVGGPLKWMALFSLGRLSNY